MTQLIDNYNRRINYLRLSVTDRCNMRCRYCMPAEGVSKLTHGDILSYEELYRLAVAAVNLGIEKIRVTGGEPLVRKGIVPFLERLAQIPGLRQLVLTTNGLLLPEMATELRKAGVQRLNVSLDSLQAETFAAVTRGASLSRVLDGIAAAKAAGFPIKLNMVVMRGVNDHEVADLAALTLEKDWSVRFIEYMPAIREEGWQQRVVPGEEILRRIAERFPFVPLETGPLAGPARNFRIEGARGSIGVITPLSGHFCDACNRIRITASGTVRSCLFADAEMDLKPLLAAGDQAGLEDSLRRIVCVKPRMHAIRDGETEHEAFTMARIGG